MPFSHLAAALFDTPFLLRPEKMQAILVGIGPRIVPGLQQPTDPPLPDPQATVIVQQGFSARRELEITSDGIAIIDVNGTLTSRVLPMGALSGLTAYTEIATELEQALARDDVRGVVLRVDSPGGQVGGTIETAAAIRAATKPVVAYVSGMAASGAYWLVSAASKIIVEATSAVGSIGVICAHLDASQAEGRAGFRVTEVFAGAGKNDLTPHAPLADDARARLQANLNDIYDVFTAAVATNRSMPQEAVRSLGATIHVGRHAVEAGLADATGSFREALAAAGASTERSPLMNKPTTSVPDGTATMASAQPTPGQAQAPAPSAEHPAQPAVDLAAIRAEGARVERERATAIRGLTIRGYEALRDTAIDEGWTRERFLEAQTKSAQNDAQAHLDQARAASDSVRVQASPPHFADQGHAQYVAPASPAELRSAWDKDASLRSEFNGDFEDYSAWARAAAENRIRTSARKSN